MADFPNPHDAFFRETLSQLEAARDFVAHYLPAPVVACFELASLRVSKDSFVDEELRSHYSDLVYEVDLKQGGGAEVSLLFEHKSHPKQQVALDLLRYQTQRWRLWQSQGRGLPLPPVVCVVFYHGPERWTVALEFGALVETPPELLPYVPQFRYALCDLSHYTDAQLKGQVELRAALLLLKHIFDAAPSESVFGAFDLLFRSLGAKTGLKSVETYLRYLVRATDRVGAEELTQLLERVNPGLGGGMMPTLAEQWLEQGVQKGLQKGMQQGELAEARAAVVEVLEARFGVFARSLKSRVDAIEDVPVLKELLRRAAVVESVESFRSGLS